MQRPQEKMQGFTLIELIVVILLVSILSIYAASRFSGVSSVSAYAAREQAISIIRQIQLDRMQSNLSSTTTDSDYTLYVSSSCLGSYQACSLGGNDRSDILQGNELSFTTSPSVSVIEFSLLGNPLGSAASGVTINIEAPASQSSVCLNAQGYVSQGAC